MLSYHAFSQLLGAAVVEGGELLFVAPNALLYSIICCRKCGSCHRDEEEEGSILGAAPSSGDDLEVLMKLWYFDADF